MAITITPESDLTSVVRDTAFTETVTVSSLSYEEVNSVSITPNFSDSGVSVNGTTISGSHTTAFADTIYYVDEGQATNLDDDYNFDPLSDSHVAPTEVVGTGNVPAGKSIIAVVADQETEYVDRTYSVVVTYTADDTTSTASFTLTQRVTKWEYGIVKWLSEYNNLQYELGADGEAFSGDEYPDES